ncbi:DUF3592 domain-containing protein [Roseisolibacter agri]|uniref:DUF3592 domain-containing protein n=1 Tax=Roseisolibacter agri TaxID=2014610 RepID=A0AA37QDE3_9BACT|nr:DUF3592 domain-containing protein [Roseisolibacter agri]GLC24633.1 hypothetical protein rosag_11460 [Roseisolibacter agri]
MTEQTAALCVIVLGAAGVVAPVRALRRELRSRAWPRAPGRVLAARMELYVDRAGGRAPRLGDVEPIIRAEYTVDGVRYSTASVRWAGVPSWAATRTLARYPEGAAVVVAYDPAEPTVGLLEPGPTLVSGTQVALGLGAVLLGLLWLHVASAAR